MNVKDTILTLIKYYDYPNKWSVYQQLFSTIGNGYEWHNGQLIDSSAYIENINEYDEAIYNEELINTDHFYGPITDELERKFNDVSQPEGSFVTIDKQYDALYNIPEDIQPDWMDAINEWKSLIKNIKTYDLSNPIDYKEFDIANREYIKRRMKQEKAKINEIDIKSIKSFKDLHDKIEENIRNVKLRHNEYLKERQDKSRLKG